MRILVVSEWFPAPPVAGAKIRAYNLVRQLARLGDLDLVAQVNTLSAEQVSAGTAVLGKYCNSVQSVPGIPYRNSTWKVLGQLVDPVPAIVRYRQNRHLERLLTERLKLRYDAVVATISGYPSATLMSLVHRCKHPLIADSLELGVLRPKHGLPFFGRLRKGYSWWHLRRFTRRLLKEVDVVTVTSETERELFAGLVSAPTKCSVVPNALDLDDYKGDFGPRDYRRLIYAGSFGYIVNYEAMSWFTREVFARITGRETLNVCVTGNTAGRDLAPLKRACQPIQFTGFVDDIRPYFAQSGICIVPVLSGGSTRLKIIEAMAWGTPVVSTRIGAEGLDVTHGHNILLADSAAEFAHMIEKLVTDRALWRRLSTAGQELVAMRYSTDSLYSSYRGILASVVQSTRRSNEGIGA